jgi:hypothetical protein
MIDNKKMKAEKLKLVAKGPAKDCVCCVFVFLAVSTNKTTSGMKVGNSLTRKNVASSRRSATPKGDAPPQTQTDRQTVEEEAAAKAKLKAEQGVEDAAATLAAKELVTLMEAEAAMKIAEDRLLPPKRSSPKTAKQNELALWSPESKRKEDEGHTFLTSLSVLTRSRMI